MSEYNSVPLSGTLSASGNTPGYGVVPDVPYRVSLWGTWAGSVKVERSDDGGATWLPLTAGGVAYGVYTANANEAVDAESRSGVQVRLNATLASGTLNWKISQ